MRHEHQMRELSPRAQCMLDRALDPENHPGLSRAQIAGLFDPDKKEQELLGYLDFADVPALPVLIDFQRRFGNLSYVIRGARAGMRFRLLDSWGVLGEERENVSVWRARDGRLRILCAESLDRRLFSLDEDGRLYEADVRALWHDESGAVPIASCVESWLESEALLDELVEWEEGWRWIAASVPEGLARHVAEELDLAPEPPASDAHFAWWLGQRTRLHARRSWHSPDRSSLELFTRDPAVESAAVALIGEASPPALHCWPPFEG